MTCTGHCLVDRERDNGDGDGDDGYSEMNEGDEVGAVYSRR